jgi:hypothetical protein
LKRALLLAFTAISVCFAIFAGSGKGALGQLGLAASTLENPLSFFSERSQGNRDDHGLFSTKPERTRPIPHEGVHSSEREPITATLPAEDEPLADAATENNPSFDNVSAQSTMLGDQSSTGPFDFVPSGFDVPSGQVSGANPTGDRVGGWFLSTQSPIDSFGNQNDNTLPPTSLGAPGAIISGGQGAGAPTNESATGASGTAPVNVPEPPTWWLMSFGLGISAVVLHLRTRKPKKPGLSVLPQ